MFFTKKQPLIFLANAKKNIRYSDINHIEYARDFTSVIMFSFYHNIVNCYQWKPTASLPYFVYLY